LTLTAAAKRVKMMVFHFNISTSLVELMFSDSSFVVFHPVWSSIVRSQYPQALVAGGECGADTLKMARAAQ